MKLTQAFLILLLSGALCQAMPLNSSARSVVPGDLVQLISVDYRALKDSPTAMALKQQLLPDDLKRFEESLRKIGIDPDRDVDTLTFASFHVEKSGIRGVGVSSGDFNLKSVLKKLRLQNYKPTKYHNADLYPMDGGMLMSFLDENTLLFGEPTAIRMALDARDGRVNGLDSNATMTDMMSNVDSSPVWSVLDQVGTQNMMHSALGDASKVADYDTIKKRLLGSRYTMNFSSGVNFDLTVLTSDSVTAATMSSLVKAGMLYKKMSATPQEKVAIDNTTVDSDSSNLTMHFKSTDQQFQALMQSPLFAAVSH